MKSFPTRKHIFLVFITLISLRVLYYWRSDGFSIGRIKNSFSRTGNELTPPHREELSQLATICSQPFTYLGKGSQAYAFQSADGKYVLKLFKCYHLRPIPWLEELPLAGFLDSYRNEQLNRRKTKVSTTLKSYAIAHDLIPEECGLLFLQIVPSSHFHQTVTFTDKIGRTHTLALENYGFMIQKKADLIFPTLEKWIKEEKMDEAKQFLHSLVQLIVARSKKGVQDQDPDLHKNAGMIGHDAVFIDVGSFHLNEAAKQPDVYVTDVRKITRKLTNWLKPRSSELDQALEDEILGLGLDEQKIGIIGQNSQ
jgi:hypothetical protein